MGTHARALSYARIVPTDFRAPILIAGRWRRTIAKLRHTALFVYLQFVPPTAHFHLTVLLLPRRAILTGIKRNSTASELAGPRSHGDPRSAIHGLVTKYPLTSLIYPKVCAVYHPPE
jgi:hypothetical protein